MSASVRGACRRRLSKASAAGHSFGNGIGIAGSSAAIGAAAGRGAGGDAEIASDGPNSGAAGRDTELACAVVTAGSASRITRRGCARAGDGHAAGGTIAEPIAAETAGEAHSAIGRAGVVAPSKNDGV